MDYEGLKNCLNLGFSNTRTSDRRAIGRYGNGFKSSFRRLGSNVIVLSKKPDKGSVSVGLYHEGLLRNSEENMDLVQLEDGRVVRSIRAKVNGDKAKELAENVPVGSKEIGELAAGAKSVE